MPLHLMVLCLSFVVFHVIGGLILNRFGTDENNPIVLFTKTVVIGLIATVKE